MQITLAFLKQLRYYTYMETKQTKGSNMKDIKNMKTSWKARLWHFFFGKEPIIWTGK